MIVSTQCCKDKNHIHHLFLTAVTHNDYVFLQELYAMLKEFIDQNPKTGLIINDAIASAVEDAIKNNQI